MKIVINTGLICVWIFSIVLRQNNISGN